MAYKMKRCNNKQCNKNIGFYMGKCPYCGKVQNDESYVVGGN